jgi:hypothetical protein
MGINILLLRNWLEIRQYYFWTSQLQVTFPYLAIILVTNHVLNLITGLDSSSSKEVCGLLKALAGKGMTVVSVIHQP